MAHQVLADIAASITELKDNPMQVVASGEGMPIVIFDQDQPAFYCVPAAAYEAMMTLIDDIELLKLVEARQNEEAIPVTLDEL